MKSIRILIICLMWALALPVLAQHQEQRQSIKDWFGISVGYVEKIHTVTNKEKRGGGMGSTAVGGLGISEAHNLAYDLTHNFHMASALILVSSGNIIAMIINIHLLVMIMAIL